MVKRPTAVEKNNEGVIRPSFKRVDERGTFLEALNFGQWENLFCGQMRAQAVMGNHYHKQTDVFFFLTDGRAEVICLRLDTGERSQQTLKAFEGILLKAHVAHAIRFEADSSFVMLKSVRYDSAHPDTFPHRVFDGT